MLERGSDQGHEVEARELCTAKIYEESPPDSVGYLTEEILPQAHEYARHIYGCRVFCRVLEHATNQKETAQLVNFLLQEHELRELVEHKYGNYVIRMLLDQRASYPEACQKIAEVLQENVLYYAYHEYGSFVVEAALGLGDEVRAPLVRKLEADPTIIKAMMGHARGRHIVNTLKPLSKKVTQMAKDFRRPKNKVLEENPWVWPGYNMGYWQPYPPYMNPYMGGGWNMMPDYASSLAYPAPLDQFGGSGVHTGQ